MTSGLPCCKRSAADFSDAVGLAEIDCHITIFHRRFDRVAQIASRGDVDCPDRSAQDQNVFPMRPAAPMSNTRTGNDLILETLHPALSLRKGEAI